MAILSNLQSRVTGRKIEISPLNQASSLLQQGVAVTQNNVPRNPLVVLPTAEEEAVLPTASGSLQATQQNPAGAELSGGLELPRPGTVQSRRLSKAYQPEQALANGTRERAWEERGARTLEPQPVNRLKSGVQSIVTTGAGAIPLIWDTAVQLNKNTEDRLERLEENGALDRLVQVNRQIRGLEGNETGEALDYIRSQERWRELDAERKLLEQQVHDAYVQAPVSPDAPGMQLMRQAGEYREEALKGLEGVPRFLGETVLSIGQNAALLPTAAINPAIPLAAMGTISAADKMYELNARGFSPSESLTRGVVSGGIEAATEKIPLENLLSVVKTGGNSALRNLLRQAGIEAGEESVSYLANYIADLAAQDPEAEFSLQELARSAAGGGISGGVFGGAAMGVNALTRPRANQTILPTEPGQTVLPDGIDNPSGGGYDGAIQENRTGGTSDARGEEGPAAPEGAIGANVRGEAGGAEEAYPGRMGRILEEGGGRDRVEGWARDHIVTTPSQQAERAAQNARQYIREVFAVDDSALKARSPRTWALTSGGRIYISDSIPAELSDVVGYHEVVHAIRQQGDQAYQGFLSDEYPMLDHRGEQTQDILDLVVESRFPGKNVLDLTTEEALVAYDELNALVWGYHKADPANARAQFAGVFQDYDAYIQALDRIMEDASAYMSKTGASRPTDANAPVFTAKTENATAPVSDPSISQSGEEVNPSLGGQIYERAGDGAAISAPVEEAAPSENDAYDIFGSGNENLPQTAVGANKSSPWALYQASKTEFIPEGANAARPVDVPTTDPQGRLVRRTASTAMGAKAIPDEVVGDIQNMVLRGELSYTRKGDKSAIDRAVKTIQDKGYQRAMEEFSSQVRRGIVSKDMVTLGQQLLINAANAGDSKATAEILSLYAQMETTAGQAVQAASILRKLSPNSQLYAAQQDVSELEKTIRKNYKNFEITIDPALIEEFTQQTDQAGRDMVLNKIYQNVADQVPSTWRDKWNAWRYLSMLANPRTHVRNVDGNFFFQPLRIVKDRVAAAIEAGVSRTRRGKKLERTKSFLASPELYRAAFADWANVRDVLSGNKYNDIRSEIESRRTIFGKGIPTRLAEKITGHTFRRGFMEMGRAANSWALEQEDVFFKRITYADALAGYLQANGVTAEQLRSNTVDSQLLSRARDYAGQEALRATYQDRNGFSDLVSRRFQENNRYARAANMAIDAVLPFRRTPANILVRGMEYSPAGLAKALTADLIQVKQGKMSGAEAIDHIAAGLTGSALFALGAYLFAQGIVTSGGGDDENLDQLNELTGVQNYALYLDWLPDWIKTPLGIRNGDNVTLDWLAPEALPFFMGVELMDSIGQNGFTMEGVTDAVSSVASPMLELSMLQSLNDLLDSISFADSSEKISAIFASALISYFTQAIPTLGGQVERSAEDVRMSTYTDKNLWLPTDIQYALGKASARIPGWDYQQIPYIDAWGREEGSGPLVLRMGNNFLNPAYTSRTEITPVDEEVRRLYNQTGDGGVVPDRPPRYITVNGERVDLTAAQYTQYATERGQTQFSMLEELFDQPEYNAFSITDKTAAVSDVYEYADQVAKSGISDYELDGWVAKAANSGLNPVDYILFRNLISGISGDTKREQILAVINDMNVPDADKDQYYLAAGYKESTLDDTPWN